MPAKPIIAYALTTGGVVHNTCLHPMQAQYREDMKTLGGLPRGKGFPGTQSAWHPGHPALPLPCSYCGKMIAKGVEKGIEVT